MTFTNRVKSITQDKILPKVIDNVLSDNFVTFRFMSNGAAWSGETLKQPIKIAKNTLGGSFSGLDVHSTGTVETRVLMAYDPRGYEMPVSIPGMEKAVNATEAQVLNLVKTELESDEQDMLDGIGTLAYLDGTGNSSKDFIGFDALVDDGTSVDSIGGLSRTTYTVLKGTRTASGGALDLTKLATLNSAVRAGSSIRLAPTLIVSDETRRDLYESLLTPTVHANYDATGYPVVTRTSKGAIRGAELKGGAGYTSLIYRGIPWVADEKSPSDIWMVNENYVQWYGLTDPDLKSIDLGTTTVEGPYSEAPTANTGFQWTGFMRPTNQYGEVAHIYLLGNLVTFRPKSHGRLTGVTTV